MTSNLDGRKKNSSGICTIKMVFCLLVFCCISLTVFQYFGMITSVRNDKIRKNYMYIQNTKASTFVNHLNIGLKISTKCSGRKFLVYTCRENCGGWGDRQKGIVSTFLLALMSKRSFVVNVDKPCDVSGFLDCNTYDWKECLQYVRNLSVNDTETVHIGKNRKVIESLAETDFLRSWTKTAIIVEISSFERFMKALRSNPSTYYQINWLKEFSNLEIIHIVLKLLFVPNSQMLNHMNNFSDKFIKGRQLICGHVRIGRNPSNPLDGVLANSKHPLDVANKMFQFLKQFSDASKYAVYLATDSDEVRKNATIIIPNYINLNRTIVHVDKYDYFNPNEACEGFYTALFEQYILTKCDSLVLTRSNFGVNAAYMRGHSDGLYILPNNKTIRPVTLENIQKIFNFI